MMRALTLTQPWAGLVASGIKLIENRPRNMAPRDQYGQRFAIHASRTIDESVYARIREIAPDIAPPPESSSLVDAGWFGLSRFTSAVIAVATLDSMVFDKTGMLASDIARQLSSQHRWFFGPIGYVLRDVVALATPVPCKGALGFWRLGDEAEAKVRAQL